MTRSVVFAESETRRFHPDMLDRDRYTGFAGRAPRSRARGDRCSPPVSEHYFIRSGFERRAQSNHCPLQLLDSPAVRRKLYSELGLDLPRAPICHELRAVQPQALDEELAFGGK